MLILIQAGDSKFVTILLCLFLTVHTSHREIHHKQTTFLLLRLQVLKNKISSYLNLLSACLKKKKYNRWNVSKIAPHFHVGRAIYRNTEAKGRVLSLGDAPSAGVLAETTHQNNYHREIQASQADKTVAV